MELESEININKKSAFTELTFPTVPFISNANPVLLNTLLQNFRNKKNLRKTCKLLCNFTMYFKQMHLLHIKTQDQKNLNDGNSDLKKHKAGIQLAHNVLSNDKKPLFINYMDRKNIFTSIQAAGDNTEDRQRFLLQMQLKKGGGANT